MKRILKQTCRCLLLGAALLSAAPAPARDVPPPPAPLFPRRVRTPEGLIPSGRALTGRGRITPGRLRLRTCRACIPIPASRGRLLHARPCSSPACGPSPGIRPTIRDGPSPTDPGRIAPCRRVLPTCRDSAPIPVSRGLLPRARPCTSPACGPSSAPEGASISTDRPNAERKAARIALNTSLERFASENICRG